MSPDSVLRSRTSTSQLPVSVPVAHGVLRSRTSTFLFVAHALMVVFKVFLQDRVPHSVLFLVMRTIRLNALAQCSWLLGTWGLASSERMEECSSVSSRLLGSSSRLAVESPFALRRGLTSMQPVTCTVGMNIGGGLGIPPPHLGCLWFSRQCRRSSQLQLRSPPWCLSQSLCFSTIVATATGVTSCSSSADCLLSGPLVLRECLRRDVVWWWFYSWWCIRFCLGQCEADDWKFFNFPVPRILWVCMHAELLVQQQ